MKMFIGGQPRDSRDLKTIEVHNSATMELIDHVPLATTEDINEAIQFARKGKSEWAELPMHARARLLLKCADILEEHREELAVLLCKETGKIIREARGEIDCAIQLLRGYTERAKHLYGETMPTDSQIGTEKDIIFTRREPLGIVGCITPFNYPVELCMHKIASAMSVGNCVIVKPAIENPLTCLRVVELMLSTGIPGNVLQMITGPEVLVGDMLLESKYIDAISFTGSTEVGILIAKRAAETLKHVFLELGGNDPFIVFDDADLALAVSEVIAGRITDAGQICCAPKRFLVQKGVKDEFVRRLIERLSVLKIGSPLDEETDMGSLISPEAAQKIQRQVELTIQQGAQCVYGGKLRAPTYYDPTVLVDVKVGMDICHGMEVFGPVFPIIEFDTEEQAISIANNTTYGLNAGVMTQDMKKALRVASRLECGAVVINGSSCYRNIDEPHGGRKLSGLGREGISSTLEEMTQIKSYVLKSALK